MFTTVERTEHKCSYCEGTGFMSFYTKGLHYEGKCFECNGLEEWVEYKKVERSDEEYIQWCLNNMFR